MGRWTWCLACRIWATYHKGYTRYEVALPHQALKSREGYRVRITAPGGTRVLAPGSGGRALEHAG